METKLYGMTYDSAYTDNITLYSDEGNVYKIKVEHDSEYGYPYVDVKAVSELLQALAEKLSSPDERFYVGENYTY